MGQSSVDVAHTLRLRCDVVFRLNLTKVVVVDRAIDYM